MRQTYTARQAAKAGAEPRHANFRNGKPGPYPADRRNGAAERGARLRIVAAPGGVAFVEDPSPTGGGPG